MKRIIIPESGEVYSLPLIIIFGSRTNGQQRVLLEVFKALGIGTGRNMYQPNCAKPDYNWLASRFPILAGQTVDRDWGVLSEMFPNAKFILIMQDENSRTEEDTTYYNTLREHFKDNLLQVVSTDANIPKTLLDFINIPDYLKTLSVATIKEVGNITLVERVRRFLYAREKWVRAGKPVRTLDEVRNLYDNFCNATPPCPAFDADSCGICGCRIKRETTLMNKLAWATESCPLPTPKWDADVKVSFDDIDVDELEREAQKEVKKQVPPPQESPERCCGG